MKRGYQPAGSMMNQQPGPPKVRPREVNRINPVVCSHKYDHIDTNKTHYLFICCRCLDQQEVEKSESFKQ